MPRVSKMNHSYLTTYYVFFLALFHSSKKGSKVRAAPRRKISDLGFLSDQLQCVEINTVRRFGHTGSRSITKRVRLVSSLLVFRNLGWGFSTYGV